MDRGQAGHNSQELVRDTGKEDATAGAVGEQQTVGGVEVAETDRHPREVEASGVAGEGKDPIKNGQTMIPASLVSTALYYPFTMNIEMGRQTAIDAIIAAVKDFKRTGERIADLVRLNRNQEALVLLDQQEQTALQIEGSLKRCEEGYLNPEVAKKLMIMRNQFKQERNKLARLFHVARVEPEAPEQQSEGQEEGLDYEVESRLLREKEESLTQVHKKISNIQNVMLETQEMTFKQGEQLDIIGENLNVTKENAVQANSNIEQANKQSASHNRRCLCLITITLALLLVIVSVAIFICFPPQLTSTITTIYFVFITSKKMGLIFQGKKMGLESQQLGE